MKVRSVCDHGRVEKVEYAENKGEAVTKCVCVCVSMCVCVCVCVTAQSLCVLLPSWHYSARRAASASAAQRRRCSSLYFSFKSTSCSMVALYVWRRLYKSALVVSKLRWIVSFLRLRLCCITIGSVEALSQRFNFSGRSTLVLEERSTLFDNVGLKGMALPLDTFKSAR